MTLAVILLAGTLLMTLLLWRNEYVTRKCAESLRDAWKARADLFESYIFDRGKELDESSSRSAVVGGDAEDYG